MRQPLPSGHGKDGSTRGDAALPSCYNPAMEYYVPPRPWYRPRLRTLVVWTAAILVASTLYSWMSDSMEEAARRHRELLAPPHGAECVVEIDGVAPTGGPRELRGRFAAMNDQWVVLDGLTEGAPQQWIPRERVVVLQVHPDSL